MTDPNTWPMGLTITNVRPMTPAECDTEGWDYSLHGVVPTALELSDGSVLYPSRDSEGNGPGALFGVSAEGTPIGLTLTVS
jgi:hypothetical protein